MLLGCREVPGHAEVGEVGFRPHLRERDPVAASNGDGELVQRSGLVGTSGKIEERGLRVESEGERFGEVVVLCQGERLLDRPCRLVPVPGEDEDAPEHVLKARYDLGRGGSGVE